MSYPLLQDGRMKMKNNKTTSETVKNQFLIGFVTGAIINLAFQLTDAVPFKHPILDFLELALCATLPAVASAVSVCILRRLPPPSMLINSACELNIASDHVSAPFRPKHFEV